MERAIREYARKAAAKAKADREAQGGEPSSPARKYIGVRSRPGNKFGAEIIDPGTGKRVWLGTYDTREEAACAYDFAARTMMKPNARTNFPHLEEVEEEEEEERAAAAAAVLAHLAAMKRRRAGTLMEVAARKVEAAARDAVSAASPPPAPAPAMEGDVLDLIEPPTSFPEEEDVVAALEMLKNQSAVSSCKNKKPAEPVAASSVSPSPPPSSSVPAASAPHFAPAPVSGVSVSHFTTTPVLAPAPLNFMFASPHAMTPAPAIHTVSSPAPPASHFAPVFDPTPLAFYFPRGATPPHRLFHLAPAPFAVVSAAPSLSAPAPAGNVSASHFASLLAPAPAPPAFRLLPPGFQPAPAPAAPASLHQTLAFVHRNYARFSQPEAQQYLTSLRQLLSLSSYGAAVTNTSSAFQPYASYSSAAPAIPEADLAALRYVDRMLERQAAGRPGGVRVDNPNTQDGRPNKTRRGGA